MINVRDFKSVHSMRPFLVAHRGGAIGPDAPENSLSAIQHAAERGYAMVELDVIEAADGVPVLMHDSLFVSCGLKERVCNLTSKELTGLCYRASSQHVITFSEAVTACADLGLGIMLDKLRRDAASAPEMSSVCLERILNLVRGAGLESSTVAIVDSPHLRRHLNGAALFPIRPLELDFAVRKKVPPLHNTFWFGWAAEVSEDMIAALQASGVFTIVSINAFHYPAHASEPLAHADIQRFLAAGADGLQIDSIYEARFREIWNASASKG